MFFDTLILTIRQLEPKSIVNTFRNWIITILNNVFFLISAHLLLPSLIPFNPRSKLVFDDIWAGTSCTYAKSQGQIYVFGLNNYNQLGMYSKFDLDDYS